MSLFFRKYAICSLVFALMSFCLAQGPEAAIEGPTERFPDGPWMVKVYYPDPAVVQQVAAWHEPRMIDFEAGTFLVDVDAKGAATLLELGCFLELDEARTESLWAQAAAGSYQGAGIPGFPCYLTVDETYALAASWAVDFPDLVEWIDIGDSWEKTQNPNAGDDLMVAKLTNRNIAGPKPVLFVMTAVHAREYTTAALNTDFGQMLLDGYDVDPDITWLLDDHEIHLLLQANPDGRRQAETGLSWRKNANNNFCSNTNGRGVDLNRNFPFQWGCCGGSSTDECSPVYRGPAGASEPEIQAITNYVRSIFPDQRGPNLSDPAPDDATGIFFDIHSFSELVIWPYGFDNTPTPNGPALRTLGRKFAHFNQYFPDSAAALFSADGTTDDFAYGELGVASFTFELGTQFFQPCADYNNQIKPDNLPALIYAAKVARTPYLTPAGPDVIALELDVASVLVGETMTLQARLDDSRFFQGNGAEPVQAIAAAEVYIDVPPWRGGSAVAMVAADGAFDTPEEDARVLIETTGLAPGRHTVYVRGQDSAGNWGAVSAAFIYVFDPATAANFAGSVVNLPSEIPLAGAVQAGPFSGASVAQNGAYVFPVLPGSYELSGAAANHVPQMQMATVNAAQTTQVNFGLAYRCQVFRDDAEMGNVGWATQGSWAIADDDAFSGSFAWTDSPGGNYVGNQNASVTSPVVDLSGYGDIVVTFQTRYLLPDEDDRVFVEYSNNGNTWTALAVYTGRQPEWEAISLEVPALANQANAQIRFRLQTDFFTADDGFYFDDFAFNASGNGCNPAAFAAFLEKWPAPATVSQLMRFILP